jgi:hypothetical protein
MQLGFVNVNPQQIFPVLNFSFLSAKASEEKLFICNHFGIQLDNPTTILQQEEAKVFFRDLNDSKLYDFFFRATSFKKIFEYYGNAKVVCFMMALIFLASLTFYMCHTRCRRS